MKYLIRLLFLTFTFHFGNALASTITFESKENDDIRLISYNGLKESELYKGKIKKGKLKLETTYQGLLLLVYDSGQSFPLLLGESDLSVKIQKQAPPRFQNSQENDIFYQALQSNNNISPEYDGSLATLMIEAKKLLQSSQKVKSLEDLLKKKEEFYSFISSNYHSLKNSDMVRRFISQYCMMHEYVNYHVPGEPAEKIKSKYLSEIIGGTGEWLDLLKPHLPENEVLNYIVGLYYSRSMVSYATAIMRKHSDHAVCPGTKIKNFQLPKDLKITRDPQTKNTSIIDVKGDKVLSIVSPKCPVSMVQTVTKARQSAQKNKTTSIIVIPQEPLSESHLNMRKMLSFNNLYFIDDEKWRKTTLSETVELPFFQIVHE